MSTTPFRDAAAAERRRRAPPESQRHAADRPGERRDTERAPLLRSDLPPAAGRGLPRGTRTTRPEIGDTGFGVVELEGLRNSRIYDPATNRWSQTGSMAGRAGIRASSRSATAGCSSRAVSRSSWSYPDHPADSFANVRKTETYDPGTGGGTDNGPAAARSLPLFPRLHLLPNGHVYYNAAGQAFNPFGQSYDEALWNIAASYDPATGRWSDLGVPGVDGGGARRPARPRLRPAAVGPGEAGDPGRRQEAQPFRLPRLDLLADASAPAGRARPLYEGVLPDRRRSRQSGGPEPRQLLLDQRLPNHDRGHGTWRWDHHPADRRPQPTALVHVRDPDAHRRGHGLLGLRP